MFRRRHLLAFFAAGVVACAAVTVGIVAHGWPVWMLLVEPLAVGPLTVGAFWLWQQRDVHAGLGRGGDPDGT